MSSINKIFDLFSQESEGDSEEEKKQEQILVDFRNHPVYSVLMFKKMILNHIHNRKMIIVLMKQSDPKLNEENILKMGDSICFNKALDYLASLDLNNELVNKSKNGCTVSLLIVNNNINLNTSVNLKQLEMEKSKV
jgi:hypothetical protein